MELKSHIPSAHQAIPPRVGLNFVSSFGTQPTYVSTPEQKENENLFSDVHPKALSKEFHAGSGQHLMKTPYLPFLSFAKKE